MIRIHHLSGKRTLLRLIIHLIDVEFLGKGKLIGKSIGMLCKVIMIIMRLYLATITIMQLKINILIIQLIINISIILIIINIQLLINIQIIINNQLIINIQALINITTIQTFDHIKMSEICINTTESKEFDNLMRIKYFIFLLMTMYLFITLNIILLFKLCYSCLFNIFYKLY